MALDYARKYQTNYAAPRPSLKRERSAEFRTSLTLQARPGITERTGPGAAPRRNYQTNSPFPSVSRARRAPRTCRSMHRKGETTRRVYVVGRPDGGKTV